MENLTCQKKKEKEEVTIAINIKLLQKRKKIVQA